MLSVTRELFDVSWIKLNWTEELLHIPVATTQTSGSWEFKPVWLSLVFITIKTSTWQRTIAHSSHESCIMTSCNPASETVLQHSFSKPGASCNPVPCLASSYETYDWNIRLKLSFIVKKMKLEWKIRCWRSYSKEAVLHFTPLQVGFMSFPMVGSKIKPYVVQRWSHLSTDSSSKAGTRRNKGKKISWAKTAG